MNEKSCKHDIDRYSLLRRIGFHTEYLVWCGQCDELLKQSWWPLPYPEAITK